MADDVTPQDTTQPKGRTPLYLLFAAAFALLIWFLHAYPELSKPAILHFTFSYYVFAILGVTFHIASKYRELRAQNNFKFREYLPDYLFRYFQACLYVLIITSLWKNPPGTPGTEKPGTASDLSFSLTMISLFTGMYIAKMEDAFENLGDKFRDMLKGMLGVPLGKLSPSTQKENLARAMDQYLTLHANEDLHKLPADSPVRAELEKLFSIAKQHLVKSEVDAAEQDLCALDFQIRDLKHQS